LPKNPAATGFVAALQEHNNLAAEYLIKQEIYLE
jgi:hypothetical protein